GLVLSEAARNLIPTLDVAHVHHPFVSGRIAIRHARPLGIPVVFTNHTRYDIYSDAYAHYIPHSVRMTFLRRSLHALAQRVDVVIAPSPGIKQWLSDFGVTESAVLLSNCIDTQPFLNPLHPNSRDEFGFAPDSIVFCYLGRLGPEKNPDLLVDAFMLAAEADSRICMLLIGDGPSRGDVQERLWAHGLTSRVHFAGLTPYNLVPDVLAAADVFVTASVSEVHPLVIMEAMAAGLPAIGVRSPGVADIIVDGKTGILTPEDPCSFSAAMRLLARDDRVRADMSAAAREEAAMYDVRVLANEMLALYARAGAHVD
ncbi:glycosyltransferase, partial [bacterium]|nr:glycosyltransferase [bacterium]